MKRATITIRDEVNIKIEGLDLDTRRDLVKKFKYDVPYARYLPAVRLGRWDGKVAYSPVLEVAALDAVAALSIHPNPVTGPLVITTNKAPETAMHYRLLRSDGAVLTSGTATVTQMSTTLNTAMQSAGSGLYVLQVQLSGLSYTLRLVKQ
jgi:hypothetical protein